MPYCRNCGSELPAGTVYCPKCGAPVETSVKPRLAYWGERFVAWLIDVAILGAILTLIKWSMVGVSWPSFVWAPDFLRWIPFVDFGLDNFIHFLYWMFMEVTYGESIGKMIMQIKVTQFDGKPMNIGQAAIESIGKAFLLPLDCILGWIFYPRQKQRLFNYLSETVVVKA